jgi:hypothetical protein
MILEDKNVFDSFSAEVVATAATICDKKPS